MHICISVYKHCIYGCAIICVLLLFSCKSCPDSCITRPTLSHGFLGRMLEWIAICPQGLPNPRIKLCSPALAGKFTTTAPPEAPCYITYINTYMYWQIHIPLYAILSPNIYVPTLFLGLRYTTKKHIVLALMELNILF